MLINFSIISENLARTFGPLEAIYNVERQRRYTFAEYHLLTNRIVNMMRDRLGLRVGDTWLAILNNDNVSLLSFFTALKGEACACYTNTTDSLADQARQIDIVKPKVVFIERDLLPTHHALLAERSVTVVSMDPPPATLPDVLHFWDLMEGVSQESPDIVRDDREDCAVLRFTGGTTGASKAVMYCMDNWLACKDLHYATDDRALVPGFRMLHFGALSHASGIVFFPVLFKGGCTITMNDRSLQTWCRTVEREKVNGTLMVPSMLYRLLEIRRGAPQRPVLARGGVLRRVADEPDQADAAARAIWRHIHAAVRIIGASGGGHDTVRGRARAGTRRFRAAPAVGGQGGSRHGAADP